jgi:hypothetical protein
VPYSLLVSSPPAVIHDRIGDPRERLECSEPKPYCTIRFPATIWDHRSRAGDHLVSSNQNRNPRHFKAAHLQNVECKAGNTFRPTDFSWAGGLDQPAARNAKRRREFSLVVSKPTSELPLRIHAAIDGNKRRIRRNVTAELRGAHFTPGDFAERLNPALNHCVIHRIGNSEMRI